LLRRRRQIADRHVLDHAAAKRADLSHRKTSCLKGWAAKNPGSFQTGGDCDRPLTAAQAASFNLENESASFRGSVPQKLAIRNLTSPQKLNLQSSPYPFFTGD
jgi:hypothetical protein